MAWVEQSGRKSWRVRYYRDDGTEGSIGGFHDEKTADDYANDDWSFGVRAGYAPAEEPDLYVADVRDFFRPLR